MLFEHLRVVPAQRWFKFAVLKMRFLVKAPCRSKPLQTELPSSSRASWFTQFPMEPSQSHHQSHTRLTTISMLQHTYVYIPALEVRGD